ncbi:MAG: dihydroorotase [Betaproteobacteria bacterium]|nr:dihydroorotase [Betaproteobacteria bacterium]
MRIEIHSGRVIDSASDLDASKTLYIAAGKVVGLGEAPEGWHANRRIDASGLVVCPGFIDLAARLREPGFEYKATLESEMRAAIAGGVTSLVCPPDTEPPLDEPGLVEMLKHRARLLNQAHVYPLGALTQGLAGESLAEMGELAEAGCIGFSQADAPLIDTQVLWRALQYAATFGHTVWLRPQEAHLARGGVAHDGEVATRLGLAAIPVTAETVAVTVIIALMRETGARVHLCRISARESLDLVRQAKSDGLALTCDVGAHHLHLSDKDIGYFNTHCHFVPPLRGTEDRDALRSALCDGTIDVVCSDHTPVDDDAKLLPFAESEAGATGLELLLPLTLKWALEEKLGIGAAVRALTVQPARVLGLEAGVLGVGRPADVCIFDPEHHWKVEPRQLRSQGKNTPFLGLEVPGKVRYTLVSGQVVFEA